MSELACAFVIVSFEEHTISVGDNVGDMVGDLLGNAVGDADGDCEGVDGLSLGLWLGITDGAPRPTSPLAVGKCPNVRIPDRPAAIHGTDLTDECLHPRVTCRHIHYVSAGKRRTPDTNVARIALLLALHPVDRVQDIGCLVYGIDHPAYFLNLGE